jgi:CDP-diacylglycerol--serine O-phosphatidyltransferase
VDFRKTYYILPNLFTLSSVFCGFISISLSSSGQGGSDLYQAALAICFGFFFDTADGRVARLTKTQTDLGRDLDSLADLVTFGVAPAMLVYKWGLTDFGRAGIFVAGLFVCAGAMRLARFNVLSRREEAAGHKKPGKYTLGLSIPAAASVLVLMVIATHNAGQYRGIGEGFVAGIVLVLSYLMVSRIRFRSFKDIRFNRKTLGLFLLATGCGLAIVRNGVDKAFIFLLLITAYIVLGLTETIIFMKRHYVERHHQRRAANAANAALPAAAPVEPLVEDDEDAPPPDEEVLRELGAFDATEEEPEDPAAGTASAGAGGGPTGGAAPAAPSAKEEEQEPHAVPVVTQPKRA